MQNGVRLLSQPNKLLLLPFFTKPICNGSPFRPSYEKQLQNIQILILKAIIGKKKDLI